MTQDQINAIIFTLDGHSYDAATRSLERLSAAFNVQFDFKWCGMCAAYREGNHVHGNKAVAE